MYLLSSHWEDVCFYHYMVKLLQIWYKTRITWNLYIIKDKDFSKFIIYIRDTILLIESSERKKEFREMIYRFTRHEELWGMKLILYQT